MKDWVDNALQRFMKAPHEVIQNRYLRLSMKKEKLFGVSSEAERSNGKASTSISPK